MRFKDRNFPYPVLDPTGRDVIGSALQTTYSVTGTKTLLYVNVKFSLHNETLEKLIEQQRAVYVVHTDCNATFYRKATSSAESEVRLTIDKTDIKHELGLSFFICAAEAINDYTITGMADYYGDTTFQVKKGDILAYSEPENFDILEQDSLKKISSILLVREGEDNVTVPHVNYNRDKIVLTLPVAQYEPFGLYKSHPLVNSTVLTAIVTPVLVEAVQKMLECDSRDDEPEFTTRRWFRVLRERVNKLREKDGSLDSAYSLAQAIMAGVSEKAMRQIVDMIAPSE